MPEQLLAKHPFCGDMNDDDRSELLALAEPVTFQKGEKIITQGQTEQNLWIVLEGNCQVMRQTEMGFQVMLAELGPHSHFGEVSFFNTDPNSATVTAQSDMKLLRITRAAYDQLYAEGKPVALKLTCNSLQQLAERIRRMDQWITDLICDGQKKPTFSEWTAFRDILFHE